MDAELQADSAQKIQSFQFTNPPLQQEPQLASMHHELSLACRLFGFHLQQLGIKHSKCALIINDQNHI